MAQTVNIPGVGTLQFPDGMSQDDMSKAIQKNYPQLTTPNTQHPDDSGFVSGIKQLGSSLGRVGAKTVYSLPAMAMDLGVGARNMLGDPGQPDKPGNYELPSHTFDKALDSVLPPPTDRGGKISEGLSTLIASLGLPGPSGVKAAGDLIRPVMPLTGADAVKARAMSAARDSGVVIPPSLTKNPPAGANAANGWGGMAETLKAARDTNTPAINALIAKDNGLDAGSELTRPSITGQITDAVKAGYDPIRDIGQIPVDGAHRAFVSALTKADRGASNISPALGNSKIAELADALMPKASTSDAGTGVQKPASYESADLVDAISALRAKASDAFAAGDTTLGKAYKQAANGYESLIDRYLQKQASAGAPDAEATLAKFRLSRTQIAKGHDALSALNTSTGDIDPRVLAGLDEGQLTGGTAKAAQIARAFPDAVVPAKGTAPGVTAFQANMAPEAIASGPGGIASVIGGVVGRNAARNYALSQKVQESLMQPKGATLSTKALNAVFSNPQAFATMYENSK